MGTAGEIPDIVISRLPVYLRALSRMAADGQAITSSHELGKRLGISSAQIRKDLSHFGEFGKQGTGYQIPYLLEQLQRILKVDRPWEVLLVGAGDLGRALAHYNGFRDRGFAITAIIDNDPSKYGTELAGVTIQSPDRLKQIVREGHLQLAMLAVPADQAQPVANQLIEAGIRGILNYAPINLAVPAGVHVQYIDPVVHLQRMTYYL